MGRIQEATYDHKNIDPKTVERFVKETGCKQEQAFSCLQKGLGNWDLAKNEYNKITPGATKILSKEDEELQKAIRLSQMEAEEKQLSEIRKKQETKVINLVPEDDTQLQSAVLASLQSVSPHTLAEVVQDMNARKREDGLLVGLKNVGNTCYANSLLQTYFMIPTLRLQIFSIPTEVLETDDVKLKHTKKFLQELQILFTKMMYTNLKWIDPSPLLNSIVDNDGKKILTGNQEDLSEFMTIFVGWMERALALIPNRSTNLMTDTFQIRATDILSAREEDGTPVESSTETVHSFFLLDVKYKNLYYALDEALVASHDIDWTTPKNYATRASKCSWVRYLPPVLMFQENRVQFDLDFKELKKLRTPMTFPHTIDMARYLYPNRQITSEKRIVVSAFREREQEALNNIHKFDNYVEPGTSAEKVCKQTLKLLESPETFHPTFPKFDRDPVISHWRGALKWFEDQRQEYTKTATHLKDEIIKTYADVTGNPYELFALWIHAGPTPGAGHYWAYIRDFSSPEKNWVKFNDMVVSFVKEEEVFRHAVGGEDSAIAAYFLIYISQDMTKQIITQQQYESAIPVPMKQKVLDENKEFTEALNKKQSQNNNNNEADPSQNLSKVDRFLNSFSKQFQRLHDAASYTDPLKEGIDDYRIFSFTAFCLHLAFEIFPTKEEAAKLTFQEIFRESYGISLFEFISSDANNRSEDISKIQEGLFDKVTTESRKEKSSKLFDSSLSLLEFTYLNLEINNLKKAWEFYQRAFVDLTNGINLMKPGTRIEGLKYFLGAYHHLYNCQNTLHNEARKLELNVNSFKNGFLKFPPPIKDVIRLALNEIFTELLSEVEQHQKNLQSNVWADHLRLCTQVVHSIFSAESNECVWFAQHRQKFFGLFTTEALPPFAEAAADCWIGTDETMMIDNDTANNNNTNNNNNSKFVYSSEEMVKVQSLVNDIKFKPIENNSNNSNSNNNIIPYNFDEVHLNSLYSKWQPTWEKFLLEHKEYMAGFPNDNELISVISLVSERALTKQNTTPMNTENNNNNSSNNNNNSNNNNSNTSSSTSQSTLVNENSMVTDPDKKPNENNNTNIDNNINGHKMQLDSIARNA